MRTMKDSGIDWIGQIPEDWNITTYRRILNCRKEYDDTDKQVLSLTIQGVKTKNENFGKMAEDFTGHQIVRKGDLVFTPRDFDATPILSGIAPCDGCISNLYFVLFPHKENETYIPFINYFMWGVKWGGDIWKRLSYGMRFSYNYQQFGALPLAMPSYNDQTRIADYLDDKCGKIDRYIEKQQQIIEKLKEYKQAVITEAVTKGLDQTVPMKDSGIEWIGMIPENWLVSSLKRYCSCTTGSTPSTLNTDWFDGDIKWYTPGDFSDNPFLTDSQRTLSRKAKDDGVATMVDSNTVLIIGIGGTAGKIGFTPSECSFNQQITAILPRNNIIPKYLMYWMVANSKFMRETALFTTLPILNNQTIGSYLLIVPQTNEEQENICHYLDSKIKVVDEEITKVLLIIEKLIKYKKSLIYEAVTGKVEI